MNLLMSFGRRFPFKSLALGVGVWVVSISQVAALADGPVGTGQPCPNCGLADHNHGLVPPGAIPPRHAIPPRAVQGKVPKGDPFNGFGLGYHMGFGYGGAALGVNPNGGYPFYGGPGYPACDPVLRRFGPITPFPYHGGTGFPTAGHPNYFGGIGPLVPDAPVITFEPDPRDAGYVSGYGSYTGGVPDAERQFASFTLEAAFSGTTSGVISPSSAVPHPNAVPAPPPVSP